MKISRYFRLGLISVIVLSGVFVYFSLTYTLTSGSVSVPILLYHEINDTGEGDFAISKDVFLEHLDAIQEAGYQTITFEQMIDYVENGTELPEKPIVITFDDGYLSNYEIAWPALLERDMVGTIFVIGCSVGKTTYKETGVSITPHFSYEQAQEMIDSGVISIQSHTYDMHQYLPLETGEGREGVLPKSDESDEAYRLALETDLYKAKNELESNLNQRIQVLSYPFGLCTEASEEISRDLGFKITVTTEMKTARLREYDLESLRLLGRYSIDDCSPDELLFLIK